MGFWVTLGTGPGDPAPDVALMLWVRDGDLLASEEIRVEVHPDKGLENERDAII